MISHDDEEDDAEIFDNFAEMIYELVNAWTQCKIRKPQS